MKNVSFFIFLIILPLITYSAGKIFNSENTGNEGENTSYLRSKWFLEERLYPLNEIPPDAYRNAFNKKMMMRSENKANSSYIQAWHPLGPSPGTFYNWGFVSGKINAVKINPVNPQIIYTGAANGGVWKSTDGGLNWAPMPGEKNMPSLSSGALAIDPNNPQVIYYGTGEATSEFQYAYYGRGIFKSTDGGVSWFQLSSGFPDPSYVSRIIVNPDNSNIILAACVTNHLNLASGTGVYRSINAGQSWNKVVSGVCNDIIFKPDNPNIVYISGPTPGGHFWEDGVGLCISTNAGSTFVQQEFAGTWGRSHLAISRNNPEKLYLARAKDYFRVNIFIYDFQSHLWQNGDTVSDAQTGFNFFLYADPFNSDIVFLGLIDIFESVNGGLRFKNLTECYTDENSNIHADQHNMDFHPSQPGYSIVVNDGGLYKTTNGGTKWNSFNKGLNISQVYRIAVNPFNFDNIFCGTTDNGLQRRESSRLKWQGIRGGDYGTIVCSKLMPGFLMGTVCSEGEENPEFSYDNGNTWYLPGGSLPTGSRSWLAPIIPHPVDTGVFYFAKQRVWKTMNNGYSWIPVTAELPGSPVIQRLAADFSSVPVKFYAATGSFPFPVQNQQLLYTAPEGSSEWTNITNGLPNRYKTCIAVDKNSGNQILVTMSGFAEGITGQNVYRSVNYGVSWENIGASLPNTPVNNLIIHIDPSTGNKVYIAATDVGVFYTLASEINWVELGTGLPNVVCMHLDIFPPANKLTAATFGRGAWEISLNDLLIALPGSGNNAPAGFKLNQNYPNPFNTGTKISFNIPPSEGNRGMMTSIIIFDILGSKIETLVNKHLTAGTYIVSWDGSGYSSGIYFYKISAGSFTDTKKMILLK